MKTTNWEEVSAISEAPGLIVEARQLTMGWHANEFARFTARRRPWRQWHFPDQLACPSNELVGRGNRL